MKKIFLALAVVVSTFTMVTQVGANATVQPSHTVEIDCSLGVVAHLVGYGPDFDGHITINIGDQTPVDESIHQADTYWPLPQRGKSTKWKVTVTGSVGDFTQSGSVKCGSTKKPKKPKVTHRQFAELTVNCAYAEVEVRVLEQAKDWYYDPYANTWNPNYSGEYEKSVTKYTPSEAQCPSLYALGGYDDGFK